MGVTDLWKGVCIIKAYGSTAEVKALDRLHSLVWDHTDCKEADDMLEAIVDNFILDTANEIYANNKDSHNGEWFMKQ